ncbi:putative Chitin binding Peritrophin-A domain-containing protein 32 [Homarus americanus]|uniref:Putative Chitin binding Peritrophin-A domain-containing protein 32 n=1 Tax=Homarus americanus TaxID=6706 RepID=A0A8J5J7A8_HOMAM|nr:putative Chitin binding Peritrophin-A domain-containing protein 32 [Homarus americanus]
MQIKRNIISSLGNTSGCRRVLGTSEGLECWQGHRMPASLCYRGRPRRRRGGYYADPETRCQAFHICQFERDTKVLCPNGTLFDQEKFNCIWWNAVDCSLTESFYELNKNIGVVPPDSI